jgi:hypothetical protein
MQPKAAILGPSEHICLLLLQQIGWLSLVQLFRFFRVFFKLDFKMLLFLKTIFFESVYKLVRGLFFLTFLDLTPG